MTKFGIIKIMVTTHWCMSFKGRLGRDFRLLFTCHSAETKLQLSHGFLFQVMVV